MKKYHLLLILLFLASYAGSQEIINLSLYLIDEEGESVSNCHLIIDDEVRMVGNQFGFISAKIKTGEHKLEVSHISYKKKEVVLNFNRDSTLILVLESNTFAVVDIYADRSRRVEQLEEIAIKNFKEIPGLTGTPDILSAITLLPGVSNGKEGDIGFSVRGGEAYQNAILLDRSLLLNPNHLFGFLSTINAKVVNDVKFYKNHIPSKYGNAGASVVDIDIKDGNKDSIKYDLDLGLTNSGLVIDGPITEKLTFLVGARAAYLGVITSPTYFRYLSGVTESYSNYNFYDYNLKLKYATSPSNRITFHIYRSLDKIIGKSQIPNESRGTSNYGWQNQSYNISQFREFKNGVFWNNSLSYSKYQSKLSVKLEENLSSDVPDFSSSSRNSDYSTTTFQSQVSMNVGQKSLLRLGLYAEQVSFIPVSFEFIEGDRIASFEPVEISLNNLAAYIDNDFQIFPSILINYGIRVNRFLGENLQYWNLEPRISLRKFFGDNTFLEASYNKLSQNRIQFSLKNYAYPLELNIPIGGRIFPPTTQQVGLTLVMNKFLRQNINSIMSVYYKEMTNLTTFQNVIPFTNSFDENYEDYLAFDGIGKAFGFEASFSFEKGFHNILANYHLSRSFRKYSTINESQWFSHEFDRPHEFSLTYSFDTNKKFSYFFHFTLNSGTPTTLPTGVLELSEEINLYFFKERNNYRLPSYHRADVAISCKLNTRIKNPAKITFSVYNAYYNRNVYDVVVYKNDLNAGFSLKKLSLLPIIPSLTYNKRF